MRCRVCGATQGHHPACPNDCVCDLYGPDSCDCEAAVNYRAQRRVRHLGLSPAQTAELAGLVDALTPGEVRRFWNSDGTPRSYGRNR